MADPCKTIKFLYLSMDDVLKVGLTMAEVMDLCSVSLTEHNLGRVENPPKPGVHPLPDAFIHAMPAFLKELKLSGIKWVSGFPSNVPKRLPTIVGTLILNDCETGFPTTIMDATYITAIRTAAVSGISAKHLARPDSEVLTVIGLGVQGKYNTLCMLHLFKNLKTIKVYDIYAPSIDGYVSQITPLLGEGIKIEKVGSYEEAMKDSDIILTATGQLNEVVFRDEWVKPGALVLPIHVQGWNKDFLVKFDKLVVDDFQQFSTTMKSKGTYEPIPDAPYAHLGEILTGKKPGRENSQERILSVNYGLAIHDMVVGSKVLEKAKELGLGQELCLMDASKPIPLPPIA